MHESAWVSAHAFHPADLDELLVRVVSPLVGELTGKGLLRRCFFLRYWDGGNHLRLRILPDDPADRPAVRRLVEERFADHFARHPAAGGPSPEEYAAQARALAAREGVRDYEPRPFPVNTVRFMAYRREHGRYGYGADIEAVERHFDESSRLALALLTRGLSADRLAGAGLAMLLLTRFCGGRPPAVAPEGEEVPARVVELAGQMRLLAGRAADLPARWPLVAWARSVSALARALDGGGAGRPRPGDVLDLCAHLVCNRLGLAPPLESRLRRLTAGALARLEQA
ncbi:lantibiotic dehydratase C-terminal domain-containing protein [Nonomuraea sp. NPDC050310]|uniref:lantibiotic dehydratase C-terminal domain-containing protein n=1 Tax=Nonomuraea sp. NPDC050310 TaxID=3154935 RepID=UPI003404D4AB